MQNQKSKNLSKICEYCKTKTKKNDIMTKYSKYCGIKTCNQLNKRHIHKFCDSCYNNKTRKQEAINQKMPAHALIENYKNCPKIDQINIFSYKCELCMCTSENIYRWGNEKFNNNTKLGCLAKCGISIKHNHRLCRNCVDKMELREKNA
jgi:hypothetical protein